MELLFQQFSTYPAMLISFFGIDMLHAMPPEEFKTLETDNKKVCFIEFAVFPLFDESLGLGLILAVEEMRVFPAFMRFKKYNGDITDHVEEYELLQYIEIEDSQYREKFNGDFRSSIGEVLREM